jgi:hypothetical protein
MPKSASIGRFGLVEQHVLGLHVAMDHAAHVRVVERLTATGAAGSRATFGWSPRQVALRQVAARQVGIE